MAPRFLRRFSSNKNLKKQRSNSVPVTSPVDSASPSSSVNGTTSSPTKQDEPKSFTSNSITYSPPALGPPTAFRQLSIDDIVALPPALVEPPKPNPPTSNGTSRSPPILNTIKTTRIVEPEPANGHAQPNGAPKPLPVTPTTATPKTTTTVIAEAYAAIAPQAAGVKISDGEKVVDAISDKIRAVDNAMSSAEMQIVKSAIAHPIIAAVEAAGVVDIIESSVHTLAEGMPIFMKALDAAKTVHPFIGVAVLAFQAVYTLEMKRRDNDKKIIALYAEMKSMMAVLIDLKDMKDIDKQAPDGTTVRGRLLELCEKTASDIKACSNACDTYSRKKFLVKFIKAPIWETRLASFAGTFTTRRSEFQFALTIHSAQGIDNANLTLANVEKIAMESNERMKMMLAAFEKFTSPEQKDLQAQVKKRGLDLNSLQEDDKALEDLLKAQNKEDSAGARKGKTTIVKQYNLNDLKQDLSEDLDAALDKNFESFSRKFEMQQRQIVEELSRVVRREGDRIIAAVTAGPHERIVDKDIHEIWKEMGWKGSVKARHFVLALRDYFTEKNITRDDDIASLTGETAISGATVSKDDDWALAYVDLPYLQSILEAIDDDASGFITVSEVNRFTRDRPLDWSLLKWLAYWALGFNNHMVKQKEKIQALFDEMFAVLPTMLPENRSQASLYLSSVWQNVTTITGSFNIWYIPDSLPPKFESYETAESARMQRNLEDVRYDIDEMDTLSLVTGVGRIEKNFFQLVRLLLERHLQIFHLARDRVLDEEELVDAASTMAYVDTAIRWRWIDLKEVFSHQPSGVNERAKEFAFGLFECFNDPGLLWSSAKVKSYVYNDPPYEGDVNPKEIEIEKVLNYHLVSRIGDDVSGYDLPEAWVPVPMTPNADMPALFRAMLGSWNVMSYFNREDELVCECIYVLQFSVDDSNEAGALAFRGDGIEYTGEEHHVKGQATISESGELAFTFAMKFSSVWSESRWSGTYDADKDILTGSFGDVDTEVADRGGSFYMSRTPCEILRHRPAMRLVPAEGKAKALWKFAREAVLDQVQRRRWSWEYFKARRDVRTKFCELYVRRTLYGRPLDGEEDAEFSIVRQKVLPADARLFFSRFLKLKRVPVHGNRSCDVCAGRIGEDRILCIDCDSTEKIYDTIDLCGDSRCNDVEVTHRQDMASPHLPTHNYIKLRKLMTLRHIGVTYNSATAAMERGREVLAKALTSQNQAKAANEETPDIVVDSDAAVDNATAAENGDASNPEVAVNPVAKDSEVSQLPEPVLPATEESGQPEQTEPDSASKLVVESAGSAVDAASTVEVASTAGENAPSEYHADKAPTASPIVCLVCKDPLKNPSWYCMDCPETVNTFMCVDCDPIGGFQPFEEDHPHQKIHTLVTCRVQVDDDDDTKPGNDIESINARMESLSERLSSLESMMQSIMERLPALATSP